MKVWITKYALTQGILEKEADEQNHDVAESMITVRATKPGYFDEHYHGQGVEWHTTQTSAKAYANIMAVRKIESLKKQIAKLEKMNFNAR